MVNFHHTEMFPVTPSKTGKVYIWLTRYGVLYFAVLLVMLLGALNYKNNMGLLLTFLLAGISLISLFATHRILAGIEATKIRSTTTFSGDPMTLTLEVKSKTVPVPTFQFTVNNTTGPGTLDAGEAGAFSLSLPTDTRGHVPLDRIRIETVYPLGLFRAWRTFWFEGAHSVVYPTPHAGPIPLDNMAGNDETDGSVPKPGAEDFNGHRPYQPGDSPKHIDWRVYSRGQGLFTKTFAAPAATTLYLNWDSLPDGDAEHRLSVMCHAILKAHREQWQFGVLLPWVQVPPAVGPRHVHGCLSHLANMGNGGAS